MLFLSIGLWCVVVYSMRVAVAGNPLYRHLVAADADVRRQAELMALGERVTPSETAVAFLQRFSRLTILELCAFLLEIGLLLYLWATATLAWLCLVLLVKNLALLALSAALARNRRLEGLFDSILALPRWLIFADRVSSLVSGSGCLILFLAVNGIALW